MFRLLTYLKPFVVAMFTLYRSGWRLSSNACLWLVESWCFAVRTAHRPGTY